MSQIGSLIRQERRRAGMTLEALAAAIGCSKGQLSLMETGRRTVSTAWAEAIEQALGVTDGRLVEAVRWDRTPAEVRAEIEASAKRSRALVDQIRQALHAEAPVETLRQIVEETGSNVEPPRPLRSQIPIVNSIAAGYPIEFTDLGYPARVADEYIACPDITDPDAFAARVSGDSMHPEYREGEIVVFSPEAPTPSGRDCFIRLLPDNETTFKRVFFEDDGRTIRLQPLNPKYTPQFVDREDVGGIYAAVYVMRPVGSNGTKRVRRQ